jgi:hypothetical protein
VPDVAVTRADNRPVALNVARPRQLMAPRLAPRTRKSRSVDHQ